MSEKKDNFIFDINEIFQKKNLKKTKIYETSYQNLNKNVEIQNQTPVSSSEYINAPDQKKEEKKNYTKLIIYVILFIAEIGFTIFMLYNLYYLFNRPSNDIDLSSPKYNNTLKFLSMASNLGTINGTTLEMFHDVNISRNTNFVNISKIGLFFPNGTIVNQSFNINGIYTDNLIFLDKNVLGRGDFKGNLNFNHVSITPTREFNPAEIVVGPFSVTNEGIFKQNNAFDFSACPSNAQLLETEDQNSGNIIGQYNRKLVVLKNNKIYLQENDSKDHQIFDIEGENYEKIEFINFIAKQNEMGLIIKNQNNEIQIFKSNIKLTNLPNNIKSASLFQNKSLIYCIDDCHEIKIMPNIDIPEKTYILLQNSMKNKFLAGRLYAGKIILATTDIKDSDNSNPNVFVLKLQNPIDISTFGKMAIITDYIESENKYNFYLYNNRKTKLITSICTNTVKASFIDFSTIIIAYSDLEIGSSYIKYDVFSDQLSSEISIKTNYYDSFYISYELHSLFGNSENSSFSLLIEFTD